jgi:hypothetical protein
MPSPNRQSQNPNNSSDSPNKTSFDQQASPLKPTIGERRYPIRPPNYPNRNSNQPSNNSNPPPANTQDRIQSSNKQPQKPDSPGNSNQPLNHSPKGKSNKPEITSQSPLPSQDHSYPFNNPTNVVRERRYPIKPPYYPPGNKNRPIHDNQRNQNDRPIDNQENKRIKNSVSRKMSQVTDIDNGNSQSDMSLNLV